MDSSLPGINRFIRDRAGVHQYRIAGPGPDGYNGIVAAEVRLALIAPGDTRFRGGIFRA
jgi:hypothetical protein